MLKTRVALEIVCLVALSCVPVLAQDMIYDWKAKKKIACPAEISKPTVAQVVITNVNDFLYSYDVTITASPRVTDDFKAMGPILRVSTPAAAAAGGVTCSGLVLSVKGLISEVKAEIQAILKSPEQNGVFKSIPLAETQNRWKEKVGPKFQELTATAESLKAIACPPPTDTEKATQLAEYDVLKRQVEQYELRLFSSSHQVVRTVTLSPDTDYTVIVEEKFTQQFPGLKTETTEGGKQEFACTPNSNTLVLTAGVMLTTLEQRSYLNRKNAAEKNVLSVDGTGPVRAGGVALLNYGIPHSRFCKEQMGFSLSSGLVIDLGSMKSDVSRLGWFAGVSFDLYRRLYITPGVHIGEFADFPVGFGPGAVIPANFGELNPVKRWTGRFAIAITYRTAGFGK